MNKNKIKYILLSSMTITFLAPVQAQNEAGSNIASRTKLQATGNKAIEQRVYDNGLGDIVQEVQSYPGSTLKSVVVNHEYDELRRKTKSWQPVYSSTGSDFVSNVAALANSQYKKDSAPFSRTEYDNFLPSQPSAQYKAGAQWQNYGKKVSVTYREYEDYYMYVDFEGDGWITMSYKKMKYLCTKTIDEDGCISTKYTDWDGKLQISETSQGKTYYIYNQKGDLSYVLPPALSKIILEKCKPSNGHNMEISETDENTDVDIRNGIKKYAYIYRYDYQRNCIYKKLPGCEPIYYIYDKAGNCILTQDGNQRKNKAWIYNIPDKLGRPCISGICHNSLSYTKEPLHSVFVYAEYDGASTQRGGYTVRNLTLKSDTLYAAKYYDDYSFIGKHGVPTTLKSSAESGITIDTSLGRGLQTGSATAILKDTGVSGYMYSAMYYDSRYNVAQVKTKNHLGGIETVSTTYSYTGKPKKIVIRRDRRQAGDYECYTYTYDNADRQLSVTHKCDNGAEMTLHKNSYDDLGRLWRVYFGQSGSINTTYTYDIHSWVTNIRTVSYSKQSNIFDEKLMYADSDSDNPCYNGNISAMKWNTSNGSLYKQYNFKYDNASRLLSATYSESSNTNKKFDTQYKYNTMGNITSIKRYGLQDGGKYELIDDLTLTYSGNRLVKVKDAVSDPTYKNAWNFVDGANSSTGNEYAYDRNGNVIKDMNKGIENIVYNTLNLPSLIKFADGKSIKYTYSADGCKLRAEYITTTPATTKRMDYCGNIIYEDSKSKQLLVEDGYIPLDDMSGTYRFYVKDHLGNNRMVVHEAEMIEQVNDYYPYGGLMSSSTGWNTQRFKYNSKEFDRMHGLDWYDYGARWMDAALGRWHSMDPLCEKYYSTSPYAYCLNNPVKHIDPNGEWVANIAGAIVGAAVELGSQVIQNKLQGRDAFDKKNFSIGKIGLAAAEGAVTCGGSAVRKAFVKAGASAVASIGKAAIDASNGDGNFATNLGKELASSTAGKATGKVVGKMCKLSSTASSMSAKLQPASTNKVTEKLQSATGMSRKTAKGYAKKIKNVQKQVTKDVTDEVKKLPETGAEAVTSIAQNEQMNQ